LRFNKYGPEDIEFLNHVSNHGSEDDLNNILHDYVLDTISHILRIISNIPIGTRLCEGFKWQRLPIGDERVPAAHFARWSVFTLVSTLAISRTNMAYPRRPQPPDLYSNMPVSVFLLTPDSLDDSQLRAFAQPRKVGHPLIDRNPQWNSFLFSVRTRRFEYSRAFRTTSLFCDYKALGCRKSNFWCSHT
jgi:hypothetical protein